MERVSEGKQFNFGLNLLELYENECRVRSWMYESLTSGERFGLEIILWDVKI